MVRVENQFCVKNHCFMIDMYVCIHNNVHIVVFIRTKIYIAYIRRGLACLYNKGPLVQIQHTLKAL